MDRVGVGVVGVGYLGKFHAQKYSRLPDAQLVGVVDIIEERAREVARWYNTTPYYRHQELIGVVKAVSIAVPTPVHYSIARDFLDAGVDVLLEKPMTVTIAEAKELIALAREREAILQVGHLERFNSAVLALEGTLSEPMFIESHRLSPFEGRGTEVDVVLDLMIHDIDIILTIVRAPVEQISAVGVPVISNKVDIANARLTFANGCVANVTASRISLGRTRKIRIFQPDAYISIDYAGQQISVVRLDRSGSGLPGVVEKRLQILPGDSLEREIEAFIQAVKDRGVPVVSGEDGLRALEVAHKIEEEIAHFARSRWAHVRGTQG